MKPSNPFLTPNFEDALEPLKRGPLTSNQAGVLNRPVYQLAEAVRSLHGKVAGLEEQLKYAKAPVDKGIPMHTYRVVCEQRDHELGERQRMTHLYEIEVLRNRDLERALAAPPAAAVEAVEAMRKALEAHVCGLCCNRIGWTGDLTQAQKFLGRGDWRTCVRCRDARAALAAYEEATRG